MATDCSHMQIRIVLFIFLSYVCAVLGNKQFNGVVGAILNSKCEEGVLVA